MRCSVASGHDIIRREAALIGELVIVVGLSLAGAAAVAATVAAQRHHGKVVQRRLAEGVAPLGLALVGEPFGAKAIAKGKAEGLDVVVRYIEPPRRTRGEGRIDPTAEVRVEIELPGRMPAGQRVLSQGVAQEMLIALGAQDVELGDAMLDPMLRVVSDEPESTRELLCSSSVALALRRAAGRHRRSLDLDGTRLVLRESYAVALDPGPTTEAAIMLARALVDAFEAPWVALAISRDMELSGQYGAGPRSLTGRCRGVDVKVSLGTDHRDAEKPQTRVLASISPPLPGGVRVRGRARGAARSGILTGDPVVDSVLDVQAVDVDAARALLADAAVTGPLLEVLHGHPGSYVHPRGVVLVAPGWLRGGLSAAVDTAVDLALALSRG